jgi:hypothetical protein
MKPDQVATAITQALVQGGSLWLIATIVAFLPALWTMTLILHLELDVELHGEWKI